MAAMLTRARAHRRLAVAVCGTLALTGAVGLTWLTGASAASVTLPDMQMKVPTADISIGTNSANGHRQLQFTDITWDTGTGPFEIDPAYNAATGTASFTQAVYHSPSPGVWQFDHSVPLAVVGAFDAPSDYRFPLTRFTLNHVNPNGSVGPVVKTSPKTDYCITADAFVGGVPNTPGQTFIPPGNCSDPSRPLGWSVGWGDEYDQTDNGQPIDLTGVPDGTYVLRGIVDPEHILTESNRDNNVVDTRLRITGTTVTVLSQTRPVAIRWDTTTAPNGTHTLSARATDTSGKAGTSQSVTVAVQNPAPPMTCFVMQADVSVHGRGTITTPAFHTAAAGETLLAFVGSDGPARSAGQTVTVSGAGLRWALVKRANGQFGDAEIWQATASSVLSGATVTSTPGHPGYDQSVTVIAMEGTAGVGASASASAASGAPTLSLTTTKPTSLIFAVGNDRDSAVARTLPAGWVSLNQWVDMTGDTFWSQYTNVPVPAAGTLVTVSDTAPATDRWNLVAVELTGDGS